MILELGPEYEVPSFVPVPGGLYAVWCVRSEKGEIPADQPEALGMMRICTITKPGDRIADADGALISFPIQSTVADPQGRGVIVVTTNCTYRLESIDAPGGMCDRMVQRLRALFGRREK